MRKTNLWVFILTAVITAVVAGSGVYYWQTKDSSTKPEFGSLLLQKKFYTLPFGAAEIEGYYTTAERATSLDGSTPKVTCSAFVVTGGPSDLLNSLKGETFGIPPTTVLGSKDSNWGDINKSTKDNPIKLLITMNPVFEGELIGCMPWPFSSFTEIESNK
jgi:hypothetical protein